MMLALEFHSPWLLLGLLAAAIPVVLHLLSSARAQEVYFPTLRFLKLSLAKTARRRRLEHWLLLLLRTLLLALLALAVSEPILRAAGGFWADKRAAAVLIVDNSYSMTLRAGGSTRLEAARREAARLLGGEVAPARAELLVTNPAGGHDSGPAAGQAQLHSDLDVLRGRLARVRPASGRAAIAPLVKAAEELLAGQSLAQKAIYVFSDLQLLSFEDLAGLEEARKGGVPLLLVDCADAEAVNVGLADLRIVGRHVADQRLEFSATLVNSSPTDKVAEVWLQADGQRVGEPVRKALSRAGAGGDRATVRLFKTFTSPGVHVGQVALADSDDLDIDNVRRFALDIAGKVQVLLVRGQGRAEAGVDPGAALQTALDPLAGTPLPWSVQLRTIQAEQFDQASLEGVQAAFFADVPGFTPAQSGAIEKFVAAGGSAVFFLGPAVNADNYNQRFVQAVPRWGGLLPGRIDKPVGVVGPAAPAVNAVKNLRHPYLADLHETPSDYADLLVQRYYKLATGAAGLETVLAGPAGEPIVSAKPFGQGRVVVFATSASPEWNNLCATPLLLPMVARICLEAGEKLGRDNTYPVGSPVVIQPRLAVTGKSAVNVTAPDGAVDVLPLAPAPEAPAVAYAKTDQPGTYQWEIAGTGPEVAGARGAFATNIDGGECDLARIEPAALAAALKPADVFCGKSLEQVHAAAASAAAGDNLWDRLLAVVILLLVLEAIVANRFRRQSEPLPAALNPKLSR